MFIFIALVVWIGAAQEAAAARMRSAFAGGLVRDAMQTDFRTLSPSDTLRDAVRWLLAGAQQDFPVVENGQLVGLLHRADLLRGLSEQGEGGTVAPAKSHITL